MAKNKIEVEVVADTSKYEAGLRKAGDSTTKFGAKLGVGAAAGAAAFHSGLELVHEALIGSVEAAVDAQASQANLDQSLRRTHQSVTAMTPALEEAAGTSRKLGFTDEDTARALAKLEIATGNTKTSIKDLSVAQDLARTRHIDLSTASNALATAMTGSQRAAKQLGIIVVPVTSHMEALKASHDKLTTAAGRAEVAHAKLLDKMATGQAVVEAVTAKVKGQAAAFSETAAGAMARFHAQVEALQVKLGTALLPALTKAADGLSHLVDYLSNSPTAAHIAAIAMQTLGDVIHALVTVGKALLEFFEQHRTAALAIVGVLAAVGLAFAGPVVAIAALGVALVELYNRSEVFRTGVTAAFNAVKNAIAQAMPTIESIVTQTLTVIETLWATFGATILGYVSATWSNIKTIIHGVLDVLQGYFSLFADLIHGRWSKLWGDVVQIVRGEWLIVKGIFSQALNTIGTIAALIGRAIWEGIKAGADKLAGIVSSGFSAAVGAIRSLYGAVASASAAVGNAIVHGIKSGVEALPGVIGKVLAFLGDALVAAAGTAASEALSIGKQIVSGILSGLGGLYDELKSKLEHDLKGVLSSLNPFSSVAHGGEIHIGRPLAEGTIEGWILGSATLPAKLTETVRNAVEAARTAIAGARGIFGTAWQQLTSDALAAFDAATDRLLGKLQAASDAAVAKLEAQRQKLTPAEKQLKDEDAARAEQARQEAIATAEAAVAAAMGAANSAAIEAAHKAVAAAKLILDEAKAAGDKTATAAAQAAYDQAKIDAEKAEQASGGDPAAIAAAQKQLDDAQYAEHHAQLEAQAADERAAEDKEIAAKEAKVQKTYAAKEKEFAADRALQRRHFEQQLADLEAELEKEGASHKRSQDKIIRLLKSYGVSYKQAGKDMGESFARGLDESADAVDKAASGLAAIVAKKLKTGSPTEEGPMSDLDTWWRGFAPALVSGLDTRMIQGTVTAASTPTAPASTGGFEGGGGATFNFYGNVWDEKGAEDMLRAALLRTQNRFGTTGVR